MNYIRIIGIAIIIICLFIVGCNFYKERNWDKERLCISWVLYENSTCSSPTNECDSIKAEKNAWVQECSCQDDNLTQKIICMKKTDVWGYNK